MLKNNVPQFVAQMREMAELFCAEQAEVDRLETEISKLIKQFYIKSATYSLPDWEKEFGLPDGADLSIDLRRVRLLAKLNTRTSASVEMIANLVKQTMGADKVSIDEHPEAYMFYVIVNEDELSDLLWVANEAVYYARPAHLNYQFIERLVRKSTVNLYAGAAGGSVRKSSATVSMERLYSRFYLAGMGTFTAIRTGKEVL